MSRSRRRKRTTILPAEVGILEPRIYLAAAVDVDSPAIEDVVADTQLRIADFERILEDVTTSVSSGNPIVEQMLSSRKERITALENELQTAEATIARLQQPELQHVESTITNGITTGRLGRHGAYLIELPSPSQNLSISGNITYGQNYDLIRVELLDSAGEKFSEFYSSNSYAHTGVVDRTSNNRSIASTPYTGRFVLVYRDNELQLQAGNITESIAIQNPQDVHAVRVYSKYNVSIDSLTVASTTTVHRAVDSVALTAAQSTLESVRASLQEIESQSEQEWIEQQIIVELAELRAALQAHEASFPPIQETSSPQPFDAHRLLSDLEAIELPPLNSGISTVYPTDTDSFVSSINVNQLVAEIDQLDRPDDPVAALSAATFELLDTQRELDALRAEHGTTQEHSVFSWAQDVDRWQQLFEKAGEIRLSNGVLTIPDRESVVTLSEPLQFTHGPITATFDLVFPHDYSHFKITTRTGVDVPLIHVSTYDDTASMIYIPGKTGYSVKKLPIVPSTSYHMTVEDDGETITVSIAGGGLEESISFEAVSPAEPQYQFAISRIKYPIQIRDLNITADRIVNHSEQLWQQSSQLREQIHDVAIARLQCPDCDPAAIEQAWETERTIERYDRLWQPQLRVLSVDGPSLLLAVRSPEDSSTIRVEGRGLFSTTQLAHEGGTLLTPAEVTVNTSLRSGTFAVDLLGTDETVLDTIHIRWNADFRQASVSSATDVLTYSELQEDLKSLSLPASANTLDDVIDLLVSGRVQEQLLHQFQALITQTRTIVDANISVAHLQDRLLTDLARTSKYSVSIEQAEALLFAAEPDLDPQNLASAVERIHAESPNWGMGQIQDTLTSRRSDRLQRMRRAMSYYEGALGQAMQDAVNAIAGILHGVPETEALERYLDHPDYPIFYGHRSQPLPPDFHIATNKEILNEVLEKYRSEEFQGKLGFWNAEEMEHYQQAERDVQRHISHVFARMQAKRDAIITRMYAEQDAPIDRVSEDESVSPSSNSETAQSDLPEVIIRNEDLTKETLSNGDVITIMDEASLRKIRDEIAATRIHSATARVARFDSGAMRDAAQSDLDSAWELWHAANGLLKNPNSSNADEWTATVERMTSDPFSSQTLMSLAELPMREKARAELRFLNALHEHVRTENVELMQQFSVSDEYDVRKATGETLAIIPEHLIDIADLSLDSMRSSSSPSAFGVVYGIVFKPVINLAGIAVDNDVVDIGLVVLDAGTLAGTAAVTGIPVSIVSVVGFTGAAVVNAIGDVTEYRVQQIELNVIHEQQEFQRQLLSAINGRISFLTGRQIETSE